ncbi:MAG: hypothetical protein K0S14_2643, partial [Thermomicrobiales bacterium]|nr:hypothetical protein [Thermomicrobiales bacterium]
GQGVERGEERGARWPFQIIPGPEERCSTLVGPIPPTLPQVGMPGQDAQ